MEKLFSAFACHLLMYCKLMAYIICIGVGKCLFYLAAFSNRPNESNHGQFHQEPRVYFGFEPLFETQFERNKIKSAIKIGPNMYLSTNLYGSLWFCGLFDLAPQISKKTLVIGTS